MLCIGGGNYNKSYNDVTVLSFATMEWTTPRVEGERPETRYGHSATLVNRKIYIFGGRQGDSYFNDVFTLDISNLPHSVKWAKGKKKKKEEDTIRRSSVFLFSSFVFLVKNSGNLG